MGIEVVVGFFLGLVFVLYVVRWVLRWHKDLMEKNPVQALVKRAK